MKNESRLVDPFERLAQLQPSLLAIGPDTRLPDVLTVVAEAANDVLGGHFCVVQPYDQSSDRFLVDQFTPGGTPAAKAFKWTEPRSDGTARAALNEGLLTIEDYDKEVERYPFLAAGLGAFKGAFRDVADIKACLGMRLEAGEEAVGVLFVNYPKPHSFSEEELHAARLFANQAALAIRNIRLFEEEVRTSSRLRSLIEVTQSVSALRRDVDLKEILSRILDAARDVLEADLSVIFPYNERADRFLMDQLVAVGEGVTTFKWQEPRKTGATRKILSQNKLLATNLDDASEEWAPLLGSGGFKEHFEPKAIAGVPLRVGIEKVGVLYISYQTLHSFDEQERNLIQAFANMVAVTLRNVGLLTEGERIIRELTTLSEIQGEMLGRAFDLDQVIDSILTRGLDLIGATIGQLLLIEGDLLRISASTGRDKDETARIDDSVTGMAVTKRRVVNVSDVKSEKPYCDVYKWFLGRELGQEMRSELVVPLIIEDEVIGALNIESPEVGAFTEDHERLLTALAGQAATAIRLAQRYRELAALSEIQREMLVSAFDLDQVIDSILARGLELIGARIGQLLLVEGDLLQISASTGRDKDETVRIDDSVTGMAVTERRVVNVSDVKSEKPYCDVYKWFLGRELGQEMRSELVVPLIIEDEVIGALNIESPEVGAFTEDHERLLTALAGQAATAIRLAQRYKEQEALRNIQETILSTTFDLDETTNLILNNMLELLGATHGQLALREGAELVICGSTGADVGARVHIDDCVSGLAVKRKKPVRVADVHTEEPYKSLYKWFLGKEAGERMRSELVAPLLSGNEVIGVLNVESPRVGAFTKHDEDLLMALAGQAATAIRTAEASERKRLEEIGERSGDIVHRLTNPTGAMRWRIARLREKRADLLESDDYLASSLEDIERNTLKIQGMVRELKEGAPEALAPLEVWPLLTSALDRIEIPQSIEVIARPDNHLPQVLATQKLENVFYNLIANAVEAMPDKGKLEITANVKGEDWVEVSIRDTGRGIPDYLLEEIFEASFTTKKEEGHGLGLWWSRAFVDKCGGTITVQSQMGEGSCFAVRLRVAQ
jgi:GAF domain-containing protein